MGLNKKVVTCEFICVVTIFLFGMDANGIPPLLFVFEDIVAVVHRVEFFARGQEETCRGGGTERTLGVANLGLDGEQIAALLYHAGADFELSRRGAHGFVVANLHLGGHTHGLELARDNPAASLVDKRGLNSAVNGVNPALKIDTRLPTAHNLVTILIKLHMQSVGIVGAARKAVVPLGTNPRIFNLSHNDINYICNSVIRLRVRYQMLFAATRRINQV